MKIPTRQEIEQLKAQYRKGMRVEIIFMDDPHAPPPGTHGRIITIDDAGDLVVAWDNGCGLNIVPGVDQFRIITEETE